MLYMRINPTCRSNCKKMRTKQMHEDYKCIDTQIHTYIYDDDDDDDDDDIKG